MKNNLQNFIVSFLNHRFNALFLIGGTNNYHKDSVVYNENFLKQSIQEDIDDVVFLVSSGALDIIKKLISGPMFESVVRAKDIIDLNIIYNVAVIVKFFQIEFS